ncbi:MAG TPA: CBS domain-containing protein [Thermotogota bacterium]|nr:CBS domain-containing protein [Thermotogota bacterium]
MKVGDIMIRDISAVFEDETVERFIRLCANHMRTGLPVVDEDMIIVGMISENDIVNAVIPSYFGMLQSASFIPDTNQLKRKLAEIRKEPIHRFMNRNVITVREDDTLLNASDLLIRHKFFSLCVVDDQKHLRGLVNRSQILFGVLEELGLEQNPSI